MNNTASSEQASTAPSNKEAGGLASLERRSDYSSCSNCLTNVVTQLRNMVAERDRNQLGTLLAKTMQNVFRADRVALYRHIEHKTKPFLMPLAELRSESVQMQDAYLISPHQGIPVDDRPRLKRCIDSKTPLNEAEGDRHVCVLPVSRLDHTFLLVEMARPVSFEEREVLLAQTIVSLFDSHLTLIDYAETDTLTGLLNRKTFDEHLDRLLSSASNDDEGDARETLKKSPSW